MSMDAAVSCMMMRNLALIDAQSTAQALQLDPFADAQLHRVLHHCAVRHLMQSDEHLSHC